MPMAQYLEDPCDGPSLSAGLAHTLLTRSPFHAKCEHPKLTIGYTPKEKTEFDIGTSAHSMVLEGDDKVCVIEADDWRTKHAQQLRHEARQNNLTPLLRKHYEAVRKMVGVARKFIFECEIGPNIIDADAELTILWQRSGLWLRARPDLWSRDRSILVNYKTSESAEPESFIRRMPSLGYDLSAALYEDGARTVGHKAQEYFIVQEVSPPYSCSLVGLDPSMREVARGKYDEAFSRWETSMKTGLWDTYPLHACYAMPTSWEMDRHEERLLNAEEE